MPRTREAFDQIKYERKQRILNSAVRTFCRNGYDNTKIDDIMRDCGCSHGLMYHYFKNKDEIFCDILDTAARHSNEMVERTVEQGRYTKENFVKMVSSFLRGIEDDDNFAYFIHFMSSLPMIRRDFGPEMAAHRPHPDKTPFQLFENFFCKGQEEGWMRRDESARALCVLFHAVVQGLACQRVFSMDTGREFAIPRAETILSLFLQDSDGDASDPGGTRGNASDRADKPSHAPGNSPAPAADDTRGNASDPGDSNPA